MGVGNQGGGGNSGNKRSNHNFEHRELLILGEQLAALGLLATESTLISVLNAIVASDQDIEVLLVRDEAIGNGLPILKQVTNWELGVPTVTYENVDGTTYVPSPNPPVYVYLDPSAVLNLILAELVDQGLTLDSIDTTTANTLVELLDQGISLDSLVSLITTLNSTVATEITLAQVLVELQAINTDLDGLSLEATQQLVLTALNTVISNTTGLATEVTAALINSNVVLGNITLNSLLTAFNAEDFATETTLSGIKSKTDLLNFIATALEVTVTSSVLPTGAATEATLLTTNSLLTIMDAVLDNILSDTNAMVVDLAAIEVLITNTNALLTTIDGVLDAIKLDTANLDVALSTRATEATQLLVNANLTLLNTKLNTLGQKASADSAPVVLSTEQEALLQGIITAINTITIPAPVGGSLEATQLLVKAVLDAIKLDTANLDVTLSSRLNTLGQKLSAASAPVVLSTQQEGLIAGITNNNLPKTATSVSTTATGTVPIGASEISFFNNGNNDATVNGIPLPAGVTRTFGFKNDIDTAIAFDGNGEQILIDYMV